jgi:hypothetical protein
VDPGAHCSEEQYIFCDFEVTEKGRCKEGEREGDGGREAIGFSLVREMLYTSMAPSPPLYRGLTRRIEVVLATPSRFTGFSWADGLAGLSVYGGVLGWCPGCQLELALPTLTSGLVKPNTEPSATRRCDTDRLESSG